MKHITVKDVAKIFGKDPSWVRAGIIVGWLPIGIATRHGQQVTSLKQMNTKFGRITYTIFPDKLYSFIGSSAMEVDYGSVFEAN